MLSMSEQHHHQQPLDSKRRRAGNTEHSWCKAVPGGTGITVLALHLSSPPPDVTIVENALQHLQINHPILNSKIHYDPISNAYSYVTFSTPHIHLQPFDHSSTSQILQHYSTTNNGPDIPPLQLILEHELNRNAWRDPDPSSSSSSSSDADVLYASFYRLEDDTWVLALRLHASVCDRTAAVTVLRELVEMMRQIGEGVEMELQADVEVSLGIEEYIPSEKTHKPFWARGLDLFGYGLNYQRLSNLDFKDTNSPRASQVVRFKLNLEETNRLLSACRLREIKVCGALAAAGFLATRYLKNLPDGKCEKYALVTLIHCRPLLHPPLTDSHFGFYYSGILNTHDIDGGETLWELASRVYTCFMNAKSNNKHFSDMADLNFLMCKAIDNPDLTPSSSLRTSLMSVFEDPLIESSKQEPYKEVGMLDYLGCASVHGVGTSIALFDRLRDGELDCVCVYPSPLHSREQMQGLVDEMKRLLVDGCPLKD